MDIDYAKWTADAQREANDATGDYYYVNKKASENIGVIPDISTFDISIGLNVEEKFQILKSFAVGRIKSWRANGGIGQMFVRFADGDEPGMVKVIFEQCTNGGAQAFKMISEGYHFG